MNVVNIPNIKTYSASIKCERHLFLHKRIMVSLSGGSDSDIMLDLIQRVLAEKRYNYDSEIHYVFFDTGIEYEATKRHLDYLEQKYGITIERIKAKVPVPLGCKKWGLPFLSKYTSEMISRLQKHNFDFKNDGNKTFDELYVLYPRNRASLKWWCGINKTSAYNINRFPFLKEFMTENPPDFLISADCCKGAKKDNGKEFIARNDIDMLCLGLRKAESGIRSVKIKACFSENESGTDTFRPIWWFTDKEKAEYKTFFNIVFSDCYELWEMKRTGCAGCPFGSSYENELNLIKQYEPKLYNAIYNIFGKSYEYTRKYKAFVSERRKANGR